MCVHGTEGGQRGWNWVSRAGTALVRRGGCWDRMMPPCQKKEWVSILSPVQSHWRILINILNILVYIWKNSGCHVERGGVGGKESRETSEKLWVRENGALNWEVMWRWREWAEGGGERNRQPR